MSFYLITYNDYLKNVAVARYDDRGLAESALTASSNDQALSGYVVGIDDQMTGIGAKMMVDLFNLWRDEGDKELTKFENRAIARTRFLARLESRFGRQALAAQPEQLLQEKDDKVAKKDDKVAKKAAKPNGVGRIIGKPAGLVANFRPIRAGTMRANVLALMTGKYSVDELAERLKVDRKVVLAHASCLTRDCAIGYTVKDEKLTALYPGNRTYADAVTEKTES